jgi:uroporphyrinogen-III decarboxylase
VFGVTYGPFVNSFANPKVLEAIEVLKQAATVNMQGMHRGMQSAERMAKLGFPPATIMQGAMAAAPFDAMSDTLRGMRGIMLDMRRRPDKLLAAIEKMRVIITRDAINTCKMTGMKFCGSMLHRGSDGFMSLKQFETFYWPSLKQMWLELIDNGITPFVFYEGIWDQRLEYLADLPKGKSIGWFQSSDIYKVKDVLGDVMCIQGGMPNSLLQGGTPEQVREHTKKMCKDIGKNGGFIMSTTIGEMEGSNPELVKVWVDATKEFGQY